MNTAPTWPARHGCAPAAAVIWSADLLDQVDAAVTTVVDWYPVSREQLIDPTVDGRSSRTLAWARWLLMWLLDAGDVDHDDIAWYLGCTVGTVRRGIDRIDDWRAGLDGPAAVRFDVATETHLTCVG